MIVGIWGKANVGKSTFFKALTLAEVEIANYPFATIKPNHGIGFVKIEDPAQQFGKSSNPRMGYVDGKWRFAPVDMIDVAGLVPGAHEGKGLGSQFLNDLNMADVLIHVIDASGSTNERGEPVDVGSHDPVSDVEFLEEELDYWYMGLLKKGWDKFIRQVRAEHLEAYRAIYKQMSGVRVDEEMVKHSIQDLKLDPDIGKWKDEDILNLAKSLRKRSKPMLIAANKIDMPSAKENLKRLQEAFPEYMIIPVSAESELALKEAAKHSLIQYIPGEADFTITSESMNEKQKNALEFIKANVLTPNKGTGIQDCLNKAVFEVIKYKAIFPGGVGKLEDSEGRVLPDCFLMEPDATALDFAFRLHTDFGKNFVKAINVKTKLPVGKDSSLDNGDIIEIMANN